MELTNEQHFSLMCKNFPDYPCQRCPNSNGKPRVNCKTVCGYWEAWARKRWRSIYNYGQRFIQGKE